MELQGTIKKIFETQTFASGFQKREMILLTQEQYPQPILIDFLQDKTDLLNNLNEGDEVKIGINIRGREWTNPQGEVKYFNSITGWRIEKISETEPTKAIQNQHSTPNPINVNPFADEEDDKLPF